MLKKILILKTGSTSPEILKVENGDFEDWIIRVSQREQSEFEVFDTRNDLVFPDPSDFRAIIITGSHDMVTDGAPHVLKTIDWLKDLPESCTPTLGICFGHQLLGQAFGGKVEKNPHNGEHGTFPIHLTDSGKSDLLFGILPPVFPAHQSHEQSVIDLPPGAAVLAASDHDPHQAFRIHKSIWGIQFHPEFTTRIMRAYLPATDATQKSISAKDEIVDTPEATLLISRFLDLSFTNSI